MSTQSTNHNRRPHNSIQDHNPLALNVLVKTTPMSSLQRPESIELEIVCIRKFAITSRMCKIRHCICLMHQPLSDMANACA